MPMTITILLTKKRVVDHLMIMIDPADEEESWRSLSDHDRSPADEEAS
jgi:hypothetical protein